MRRLLLFALVLTCSLTAATHGPPKGWLIIIGGGAFGDDVWGRFFELAGGKDAPLVFIPTANDGETFGDASLANFRKAGATNVTLLHTRDRKVADSEAFVEPIRKAR